MPYSATAYRLLISAPGDVAESDIRTVNETIARWNAGYGQEFGSVVVPIHWGANSAAEHGERPQASLNAQLVASADIVVALFWHRLGSETGVAESGTVEEIEEAQKRGAYVGILHCTRDYPQDGVDPDQLQRLAAFFERVRPNSLTLDYGDDRALAQHVEVGVAAQVRCVVSWEDAAGEHENSATLRFF